MGKNANFVSHKKSKQIIDGKPKLPLAADLVEGEIAINFGKDVETLSIKNESGDVVTFSSDNYYTEKKLGSGFTGENSANTVTSVIESNEKVTALAFADLDERKLDKSAYKPTYTKAEIDAKDLWVSGSGENSAVLKGGYNEASGTCSVAEGNYTKANGSYSHAEGWGTTASGQSSHAEGSSTKAYGGYSHAEGSSTRANGEDSHAEGYDTTASGDSSHAEGRATSAMTYYSHAEGNNTIASGYQSHAEGNYTNANGNSSHAEGGFTIANGSYSHAEGYSTVANNQYEHASGQYNVSSSASTTFGDSGNTLFSVGNGDYGNNHNAFEIRQNGDIYISSGGTTSSPTIKLQDYIGGTVDAYTKEEIDNLVGSGFPSSSITEVIIENEEIVSSALIDLDERKLDVSAYTPSVELWVSGSGVNSVVLKGGNNTASGTSSVAEGSWSKSIGYYSHAEGYGTTASGQSSHAEGYSTTASGYYSHTEGYYTKANGSSSHAEGNYTTASGNYSHAEGQGTSATSQYSHAEGASTTASGNYSHAEGYMANAVGINSHAEGYQTKANGYSSHAEGYWAKALNSYSHAEGYNTVANNTSEHASGQYNVSSSASTTFGDSGNTLFSVGNGRYDSSTSTEIRHNAFEIRQNGDIYIASGNSDIRLQDYLGGSSITVDQVIDSGTSASTNAVATKAVVDKLIEDEQVWALALNELNNNKFGYANFDSTDSTLYFYKDEDDYTSGGTAIDSVDLSDISIDIDQVIDSGTSASTDAVSTSAVYGFVTSYTPSITVDQVLDNTTSASTNPVSSKAVYDAVTENELVWTNAFVALSGTVSAHTANTEIHVTAADKARWDSSSDSLWVSGSGVSSVVLKTSSGTASGDYSVAEGYSYEEDGDTYTSVASGTYSHTEGIGTTASGDFGSHAEGYGTVASGQSSHAEGSWTQANGDYSHAEGAGSSASGNYSHVEGFGTVASGESSHAEGYNTTANGDYSHAEGHGEAHGEVSHAEGRSISSGYSSHAEGQSAANGRYSHSEGESTANGDYSHAEGELTVANNQSEHASGQYNVSSSASIIFGNSGNTLFSVGNGTYGNNHNAFEIRQNGDIYITSGGTTSSPTIKLQDYIGSVETVTAITPSNSGSTDPIATKVVAENELIVSTALNDLDERKLDASAYTPSVELWVSGTGLNSVVLKGSSGTASGDYSVAEGYSYESNGETFASIASGSYSHTEGAGTTASGDWGSHAEGNYTTASGSSSHAEGYNTTANGSSSHAEGNYTTASGRASHAEGSGTTANNQAEHASGQYNVSSSASTKFGNSGNTLFSVGNGTADNARHNAFEIMQNGDIYITSGGTTLSPSINLQDSIGSKADKSDLGGLKLVKVTQAEYDALATKDPNTLYVIIN